MSGCLPHTIAVCGMYALTGYPVTRLDVGLSTYRRVAAGDVMRPSSLSGTFFASLQIFLVKNLQNYFSRYIFAV